MCNIVTLGIEASYPRSFPGLFRILKIAVDVWAMRLIEETCQQKIISNIVNRKITFFGNFF